MYIFYFVAFEKRVMYRGQEYLAQLVDTAGQVSDYNVYYVNSCVFTRYSTM